MQSRDFNRKLRNAILEYRNGKWKKSSEICISIPEDYGNKFVFRFLLGLCYCKLGYQEDGFSIIERTVEQNLILKSFDFMSDVKIPGRSGERIEKYETQLTLFLLFQEVNSFVISYPKCGRTWLRLMLGCYALGTTKTDNPLELYEITSELADVETLHVTHDDYPHLKPADKLFRDKGAYAGKRVVFMVRDPRDVLVSNYFQYTRRGDRELAQDSFEGDLSSFVRHHTGGVRTLVEFYNIWADSRGVPDAFTLLAYEDLVANTKAELLRCVEFLKWPSRDEALVDEIVAYGSFGNMRRLEESRALKSFRLGAGREGDPEGYKIRRGKVGGYRDYLNPADIGYVNDYLSQHLDDIYARYKGV